MPSRLYGSDRALLTDPKNCNHHHSRYRSSSKSSTAERSLARRDEMYHLPTMRSNFGHFPSILSVNKFYLSFYFFIRRPASLLVFIAVYVSISRPLLAPTGPNRKCYIMRTETKREGSIIAAIAAACKLLVRTSTRRAICVSTSPIMIDCRVIKRRKSRCLRDFEVV